MPSLCFYLNFLQSCLPLQKYSFRLVLRLKTYLFNSFGCSSWNKIYNSSVWALYITLRRTGENSLNPDIKKPEFNRQKCSQLLKYIKMFVLKDLQYGVQHDWQGFVFYFRKCLKGNWKLNDKKNIKWGVMC